MSRGNRDKREGKPKRLEYDSRVSEKRELLSYGDQQRGPLESLAEY